MRRFTLNHLGEIIGVVLTFVVTRVLLTITHLPRVMRWE